MTSKEFCGGTLLLYIERQQKNKHKWTYLQLSVYWPRTLSIAQVDLWYPQQKWFARRATPCHWPRGCGRTLVTNDDEPTTWWMRVRVEGLLGCRVDEVGRVFWPCFQLRNVLKMLVPAVEQWREAAAPPLSRDKIRRNGVGNNPRTGAHSRIEKFSIWSWVLCKNYFFRKYQCANTGVLISHATNGSPNYRDQWDEQRKRHSKPH